MVQLIMYLQTALAGKKTYIVGAIMVVNGLWAFLMGESLATFDNPTGGVSQTEALTQILEGLGFSTVRAGISKAGR